MSRIRFEELSLAKLKIKFENKVFAVPHIQRQFVWKKYQVTDLADSIYRGIPIGVFLIWHADGDKTIELRPNNNIIIPPYNYTNKKAEIIIDGQQRLSSIYGILKGINSQVDDFAYFDFTKIYFDLDRKANKRFFYRSKLFGSTSEYIQLSEILAFSPSILARRYALSKKALKELTKCKERFTKYRFYSLVVESKKKNEMRETFIRINSKGTIVNKSDIFFAQNVGLRDRVAETKRGLKHGFNKLKNSVFTSAIALINDQDKIGKSALNAFVAKFDKHDITKEDFKKHWKRYHNAFQQAHDLLTNDKDFEILTLSLLPSDNIFTMLSLFFYHNGPSVTSLQKRELRKWFWHTALGERYSGAKFNKNIPEDLKFMKSLAKRKYAKYVIDEKIDPIEFLKKKYSSQRSTSVRVYFLYLSQLKPKYLETGEQIYLKDTSAIANRRDRHHIFPSNLFSRRRLKTKWKNGLVNICLLTSKENQSVGDNYPCDYLEPFRKKKWFKSVMRSHVIPARYDSGLWGKKIRDDFKLFINVRGRMIIDGISKRAAISKKSLFERFDEIRRI